MYKYLEAWRSGLPAIQGAQITEILGQWREDGLIRTEEEYRDALNRLTGMITSTDPVPLVKFFPAILNQFADSESFNWMVDRLINDLINSFNEGEIVTDLLDAHQKVYEEFTLAKIKSLIEDIREEINLHLLLRNNQEGFSNLQYNTFTQNTRSTPPTDPVADQLYIDRSSRADIKDQSAIIDAVNEALELDASRGTLLFTGVEENGELTTRNDFDYPISGSLITNMIDGTRDTFYIRPFYILDENQSTDGVQLRLELDCGGLRPLNYLEIEPVSNFPFQITEIEYLDKDGQTSAVELQESGLLGQDIFRPIRYHFKEVDARKVYLTCVQEHFVLLNFFESSVTEDPEEDIDGTFINSQMVQNAISDLVEDDAFLAALQNQFTDVDQEVLLYQYVIGFDNITTGKLSYGLGNEKLGVFVSEVFQVARCRRVGLRTDEVTTNETLLNRRSSFEYWIYKQDFNAAGGLIGVTALPIMPLTDLKAYERLEFTEIGSGQTQPNIATLRFWGHYGASPPTGDEEVKVYLNGVELTRGPTEDWDFADLAILGTVTYTRIEILSPLEGEVYTVDYTPAQYHPGATTEKIFQRFQPNAYYKGENNIIFTNGIIGSEDVESSDIYLIVIMKHNNNEDDAQSPRLNEYSLLVASQDPTRLYPES